MGLSYFCSAEFIRWLRSLGTPEGQLEQPQASGTEPQALLGTVLPLQGGVREGLFCRVVRLLQRAEEGCEGLKHGYYNLPCIHFLIFLCHDIKNKIDRLFFLRTKFSRLFKIIFLEPSGTREALGTAARLSCGPCIVCWQEILSPSYYLPLERALAQLEQPQATGTEPQALPGTPAGLLEQSLWLYLERAKRIWNHPTGLRAP